MVNDVNKALSDYHDLPKYSDGFVSEHQPVKLIRASTLKPEPIKWLWDGWLAAGKLHILAGRPGTGKTTISTAIAAIISSGARFPNGVAVPPGNVLIWSAEDDPQDTLVPRLAASGANLDRVAFVAGIRQGRKEAAFDPSKHIAMLEAVIAQMTTPPKLLIVDPIIGMVAGDSHKNAEVRRGLQPLVDIGLSYGCAVLGISHFTKGTDGGSVVDRVTGSIAYGALARVVWATAKRPESLGGGRVLARGKSNLGLDDGGFAYDIVPQPVEQFPGIVSTTVVWGEYLQGDSRDLLKESDSGSDGEAVSKLEEAEAFLLELLNEAKGKLSSKQIKAEASEAGITAKTLRNAKDSLKIVSERKGGIAGAGGWFWSLPDELLSCPKDSPKCHTPDGEGILAPVNTSNPHQGEVSVSCPTSEKVVSLEGYLKRDGQLTDGRETGEL